MKRPNLAGGRIIPGPYCPFSLAFVPRVFPACAREPGSLPSNLPSQETAGFHVDPLKWGNFGNLSLKNEFLPLISICYEKFPKVIIW
ncbi:hypothetical protein NAG17_03940, partial [Pseudomonas aeruginosa]|nr:hypothetical protein [Pseudomonas aeruginosa]